MGGPYRGVMTQCYHRDCDSARMKNVTQFASYEFLGVTTQTVIDSVTDLSKAQCSNSVRATKLKKYSPGWDSSHEDSEDDDLEVEDDHHNSLESDGNNSVKLDYSLLVFLGVVISCFKC